MIALTLTLLSFGQCAGSCCTPQPAVAVVAAGACPQGCSSACTCGCNSGEPCRCARFVNGQWVQPTVPVEKKVEKNYGVDLGRIAKTPRISRQGQELTIGQAARAMEDSTLPDDAGKLRLTIIGPDSDRQRVLADLATHPALAGSKGRLLVQHYASDHWAVQKTGFVTTGNPTVYLQQADGTVLHRQDSYAGAEKLAEAIRKADPNYDPKRDPDLSKPAPSPLPFDLAKVPLPVWVGGGALLLLLLTRVKEVSRG